MAERYWIPSALAEWDHSANWSASSGGAGGETVPSVGDNANFDGNGLGTCLVDASITVVDFIAEDAYTGFINFQAYDLTATGNVAIGEATYLAGVGNSTWTITGNLTIDARTTGIRNLASNNWLMEVGTGTINSAVIRGLDASAGSIISCINCRDKGDNVNLEFLFKISETLAGTVTQLGTSGFIDLVVQPLNQRSGDVVDYDDTSVFQLIVDGSTLDLTNPRYSISDLSIQYTAKSLTFAEHPSTTFGTPSFSLNDVVELKMNLGSGLVTYFKGKIRKSEHSGVTHGETITYTAAGFQTIANEIIALDGSGSPHPGFRSSKYDTDEAVNKLFTDNAAGLAAIGVPSTIGTPGTGQFTTQLSRVPENVMVEGMGFTDAVRKLIEQEKDKKLYFDDTQQAWTFVNLVEAPIKNVRIDLADVESGKYTQDITNRFTAIQLEAPFDGQTKQGTIQTSDLTPGWTGDFEEDWTIEKAIGADSPETAAIYELVHRYYTFSGGIKFEPLCPPRVLVLVGFWGNYKWVAVGATINFEAQDIMLDVPAVFAGNPHDPGDAVGALAAVIQSCELKDTPYTGTNTLRYPPTGFEGTANSLYSLENIKYMTVEKWQITDSFARQQLSVLKDVIIAGEVPLKGDPVKEFLNLNSRFRLTHSSKTTGLEDLSGYVTGYKYSFGKPGTNTITFTTDRNAAIRV